MFSWGQFENSVACCCSDPVLSDLPLRFLNDQADLETISRTNLNDRIRTVFCLIEKSAWIPNGCQSATSMPVTTVYRKREGGKRERGKSIPKRYRKGDRHKQGLRYRKGYRKGDRRKQEYRKGIPKRGPYRKGDRHKQADTKRGQALFKRR